MGKLISKKSIEESAEQKKVGKLGKVSNPTQVTLKVAPIELLGSIRDVILDFKAMNPALPTKTARKLQKNLQIQELNANAYVKKERELVQEYIECNEDGAPLWWNQKSTEKVYEDLEDGTKKLVSGKFMVQQSSKGMILVDEDGLQYNPDADEKMVYLQKDIEKTEEYNTKMRDLQSTELDVNFILFTDEELEHLNIPSDLTFLNYFVDGVKQ